MNMPDVLNPTLYRALNRVHGEVHVINNGERFEAHLFRDADSDRPRLEVVRYGEEYMVRCRFCWSFGFNLSVNHRYGTMHSGLGRPLDFLATCIASGCLKERDNRVDLFARLGGVERLAEARVRSGTNAPIAPARLPASFTRLDRLRQNHPARCDLTVLGHDPDRLGRVFGVGFCHDADVPLADKRVVVPVRREGTLIGWMAAVIANDQFHFLAGPGVAVGRELYNLDRARSYPTTVVVPSPEWVWRVGTVATAPLMDLDPKHLARLLREGLLDRDIVVLGTPDSYRASQSLSRWLHLVHLGKVAYARLPPTADTSTRSELKHVLWTAAADRGIELAFSQRG